MTIDGLITFIGLIVALYALASDATRRAYTVHWGLTLALSVAAGAAALYLQFFNVLAQPCLLVEPACRILVLDKPGGVEAKQIAFVVVLLWLGFVAANLRWRPLSDRHLPRLEGLLSALGEEKRFSELCRLVEPQLKLIEKVAQRGGAAAKCEDAAQKIQRLIHKRDDLVRFIALERPGLAVKMLSGKARLVHDFSDRVFAVLIAHADSPLYAEVAENENLGDGGGYLFPEHNVYLHFLFKDAKQAERLAVWQPLMEAAIADFEEDHNGAYKAFLNRPYKGFDQAKWQNRTFVAIRLMDLMVNAAVRQGVQWHMWLFYAPHLLKPMLEAYDESGPGVDTLDEWPTRNAFLIYSIFSALGDWIGAVADLPDGSPHLALKTTAPVHDNGNIPKSAILALGHCLRMLLLSDRVSDEFKSYIVDMSLRSVRDLPPTGPRSAFRTALTLSVLSGGAMAKTDHLDVLRPLYDVADHILREQTEDFGRALYAAAPIWPEQAQTTRRR